jgi:hypothetical protein
MLLYKIGSIGRLCGQAAYDHVGVTIRYSLRAFIWRFEAVWLLYVQISMYAAKIHLWSLYGVIVAL